MTVSQSTRKKPKKPRRDYPLYAHPSGQWAKTINGRKHYFGAWDDPQAAERLYDQQKEALRQNRKPRPKVIVGGFVTLSDLLNKYLESQQQRLDEGEIATSTFRNCHVIAQRIVEVIDRDRNAADLGPEEFAAIKRRFAQSYKSPNSMRMAIKVTRAAFNYGVENELLERKPTYGSNFKIPSNADLRKHKARQKQPNGVSAFTASQSWKLITNANPALKAMILLGLNCGLGNNDCNTLSFNDIDLDSGWLDFPRSKTGQERLAKLWPETREALNAWLDVRPTASDSAHKDRVFLTQQGNPVCVTTKDGQKDRTAQNFKALLDRLGMYRKGLSFYSLRRTHRTWSDGAGDTPAANLIMGHVDSSMGAVYRQETDKKRLFRVAKHVRNCLFERAVR